MEPAMRWTEYVWRQNLRTFLQDPDNPAVLAAWASLCESSVHPETQQLGQLVRRFMSGLPGPPTDNDRGYVGTLLGVMNQASSRRNYDGTLAGDLCRWLYMHHINIF